MQGVYVFLYALDYVLGRYPAYSSLLVLAKFYKKGGEKGERGGASRRDQG